MQFLPTRYGLLMLACFGGHFAFHWDSAFSQGPELQPGETSLIAPPSAENIAAAISTEPQVLEEGPVHEAFAEPISVNVTQGAIINQQPPEPVNEIPPEYRPEGENVEWIPGYWSWLEERNDFVWVSGVWRAIPPGRSWTPGHWAEVDGGFVWTPGFWSDINTEQIEYLPYPPGSIEQGPSSAAPGDNHFWIPGNWVWRNQNYSWRAGYWYPGQSNWVWVPEHYCYTPRGAVWVRGYWDYPLQRRGLLYAPVYWNGGYRNGVGYAYTPNRAINSALLLSSLFINNNRGYYYYGRGFGGRNGFSPWYAGGRRGIYSPLYGYYSWQFGRNSNDWRNRFDDRRDRFDGDFDGRDRRRNDFNRLITSVDDLRQFDRDRQRGQNDERFNGWKNEYRKLSQNDRDKIRNRSQQLKKYRSARTRFEAQNRQTVSAQLDRDNRDNKNGNSRRSRVNVPDNYRPATFDLSKADGAKQWRRQARERHQKYQQSVSRQDLDRARNQLQSGEPRQSPRASSQSRNQRSQSQGSNFNRERQQPRGSGSNAQPSQRNKQAVEENSRRQSTQQQYRALKQQYQQRQQNQRRQSAPSSQGNRTRSAAPSQSNRQSAQQQYRALKQQNQQRQQNQRRQSASSSQNNRSRSAAPSQSSRQRSSGNVSRNRDASRSARGNSGGGQRGRGAANKSRGGGGGGKGKGRKGKG